MTFFLVSSVHFKCHLLCKAFYKNLICQNCLFSPHPPHPRFSFFFFLPLDAIRVYMHLFPLLQSVSWRQGPYLIHLHNSSISHVVGAFKKILLDLIKPYIIVQKYRISFQMSILNGCESLSWRTMNYLECKNLWNMEPNISTEWFITCGFGKTIIVRYVHFPPKIWLYLLHLCGLKTYSNINEGIFVSSNIPFTII